MQIYNTHRRALAAHLISKVGALLSDQGDFGWDPAECKCVYEGSNGSKCAVGLLMRDFDSTYNLCPIGNLPKDNIRQIHNDAAREVGSMDPFCFSPCWLRDDLSGSPDQEKFCELLRTIQALHDNEAVAADRDEQRRRPLRARLVGDIYMRLGEILMPLGWKPEESGDQSNNWTEAPEATEVLALIRDRELRFTNSLLADNIKNIVEAYRGYALAR